MKFEKKYISEVICLIQYKDIDNKIRHRIADAEDAFAQMFTGQSQQTNVPDNSDPSTPRLIFQAGPKQLFISQKACQLSLNFESNEKTVDEQLAIIRKNLLAFQDGMHNFKLKEELNECAIVINVNVSCKEGRAAILQHVYNRFNKVDQQAEFGELASYSFKVGYKTKDQFYLNYETDVYELRKLEFAQPTPVEQIVRMNATDIPLIEEGISIHVDVNNKPKLNSATFTYSGIEELIPIVFDFIVTKVDNVIGVN